jgi:hypothetical protein
MSANRACEWRIVVQGSVRSDCAIAHVFLGPRVSAPDEQAVRSAARRHDPAIPVIKRVPHRDEQHEHYQGAEIITDYAQLQYWDRRRQRNE